jgi:hypothetical protein
MKATEATVGAAIPEATIHTAAADSARSWRRIVFAAALSTGLVDAALIQRKHGLFTGGFLAHYQLDTTVDALAFLFITALLNATIAAPIALVSLVVARYLRLRPRAAVFAALSAAVMPLMVADFVNYQIWSYIGDAFDFHIMYALTGRRLSEVFAVASPLMAKPVSVLIVSLLSIAAITMALHRFDRSGSAAVVLPTRDAALRRCLTMFALSAFVVAGVTSMSDTMAFGLRWLPSGQVMTLALNRLTDLDNDGYGLLRSPRDAAPLDSTIHPYAVDIPGNGIDEDSLAGDLPVSDANPQPALANNGEWPEKPPVILFLLESVRNDAVGAVYDGRRVTPVLDALAADGLRVDGAWAHAGSTTQSRYHVLAGSLVQRSGTTTILDDFKNHGYDVGYFSGQDDDFGGMGLDYQRVDRFYDARQDVGARYSTSTSPGSLAVPLTVVEDRIREYLSTRDRSKPLFLYVNFHDTHYPYSHAGLDNLLDVEPLAASTISPGRRRDLIATYLNATANVDRAIGRVMSAVASHTSQRPAVIVASDHGESLFDQGVLGHGFALNDVQTRVPLIVEGLPVTVTMPFGLVDLRSTINAALVRGTPNRPVARWTPNARVFQYAGAIETPAQIGWMTAGGPLTYDFRSDRAGIWDGSVPPRDLVGDPRQAFVDLVYTWERFVLSQSRRQTLD